jgi:galactokinase
MMGGGFGGSALALVPAGQRAVSAAITAEFTRRGWPPPAFFPAVPSAGAFRLRGGDGDGTDSGDGDSTGEG